MSGRLKPSRCTCCSLSVRCSVDGMVQHVCNEPYKPHARRPTKSILIVNGSLGTDLYAGQGTCHHSSSAAVSIPLKRKLRYLEVASPRFPIGSPPAAKILSGALAAVFVTLIWSRAMRAMVLFPSHVDFRQ